MNSLGVRERRAHTRARAVKSGRNGADRHSEGIGGLLMRTFRERDQEHLSLVHAERSQSSGKGGAAPSARNPLDDGGVVFHRVITTGPRVSAKAPLLAPAVTADEVARDAVQPWQRALRARLERAQASERAQERLGGQIGEIAAEPPVQVAMHRYEVTVEEVNEGLPLCDRAGHEFGISLDRCRTE